MIQVIDQSNAFYSRDIITSFFKLRHRVFRGRLRWDFSASVDEEGIERDEFDLDDPVYLVIKGDNDEVVAGVRLLQTSKTYLLGDRFGSMIVGETPRDERILEVTRLVVDPAAARARGRSSLLLHLVWGLQSFGLEVGAHRYVSLSYAGVERLLLSAGCRFHRLGKAELIDNRACVALSFEIAADIRESCANKLWQLGEKALSIGLPPMFGLPVAVGAVDTRI